MAKDPAFLFYTGDFSTGTQFFSDEQLGKYIRLLMAQHQHGHLTEKQMLKICGTYDAEVFEKFEKDAQHLYFNSRLETEILKRSSFCKSRKDNRTKKLINNIPETHVQHVENKDENKDKDIIKDKRVIFIRPKIEQIEAYCLERKNSVNPVKFFNYYESNGWRVGKNKMKDWKAAVHTWENSDFNKPATTAKATSKVLSTNKDMGTL